MYGCLQDPQKRRRGGPEGFPKNAPYQRGGPKHKVRYIYVDISNNYWQCWINAGSLSTTLTQHVSNNRRVHWVLNLAEPATSIRGLV